MSTWMTRLRKQAARFGSLRKLAEALGISHVLLHRVLNGNYRYSKTLGARLEKSLDRVAGLPVPKQISQTSRAKIWQSMRIMRQFTLGELVMVTEATYSSTRQYVNGLLKRGYVQCVTPTNRRSGVQTVYRICKNTGPKPVQLLNRNRDLYDPNLDRIIGEESHEHVD